MDDALISVRQVGVRYRRSVGFFKGARSDFWALKNVSFEVRSGEIIGVIGRNGAGKSTLLRLIAGIILPDQGSVEIRPKLRTTLLSIGVGSHSSLSGRENAILNGMMLGATKEHMIRSLERIREFSELGDFFDEPIYSYSSGMHSRLGFATAMEADPDVMLIDEVLSVGDAGFQQKSAEALRQRLQSGKTAIVVSHDSRIISDLCRRAIWIEDGVSLAQGEVAEVTQKYEEALQRGDHRKTLD
jgi:lipopolysaccharide transport system ATP-binding protein